MNPDLVLKYQDCQSFITGLAMYIIETLPAFLTFLIHQLNCLLSFSHLFFSWKEVLCSSIFFLTVQWFLRILNRSAGKSRTLCSDQVVNCMHLIYMHVRSVFFIAESEFLHSNESISLFMTFYGMSRFQGMENIWSYQNFLIMRGLGETWELGGSSGILCPYFMMTTAFKCSLPSGKTHYHAL